jgi:DNA-binding GntR family transcriptional regulator
MSRADAYHEFRERLLSGELAPGQFVTQKELATLAGVPVGTAREAIQRLEHESLLKVHPQRGIQVISLTTNFIRNSFGLRMALEMQAVRNFASGNYTAEIDTLLDATEAVLRDAEKTTNPDVLQSAVDVDWDMHDKIIECLDNELISETYQINATRLRLIKVSNRLSPDRVHSALREHLDVLNFCKAGDGAGAQTALASHIDTAMSRALQGK